jgi:hypothetical protein
MFRENVFWENNDMRGSLWCVIGVAGVIAAGLASPASADDLNPTVRTLSFGDAQRLEEQAHRQGRYDEERYWRNYGAGLEQQHHERYGATAPTYGGARIGPDQARALERNAVRNGRPDEALYWHRYAEGLGVEGHNDLVPREREQVRYGDRIGPEQAARLEEQARLNGRWDEVHYWAAYRAGLEGRR